MELVDKLARRAALRHAEAIERELLDRNVVAVPFGGQHIVYRVPRWRERPLRRLRSEAYRRRRRRAMGES